MPVPCRKMPVYLTNCIWHGYAENALIFAEYARQVFYSSIDTCSCKQVKLHCRYITNSRDHGPFIERLH